MLTLVYRLIVLFIICLVIWDLWGEKDWRHQMMAGIVLIPLILRFLMIK